MPELMGRTVLITGASRGLGAALALAFADAGARLALCARSGRGLEEVAELVRARGVDCLTRALDVADPRAVQRWVDEASESLGPPRVLINNASLLGPRVALAEYPLEDWRALLEVNLTGALIATQAVLPYMLRERRGCVINVSSGAAVPPRVNWGAYAVSKQALEGFSLNLASELEGTGVQVNIVDPGAMRTGMRAAAYPEEDPLTLKTAEETTPVFLWLASDVANAVTGRRFQADRWLEERLG